jgi:predicted P-loop ATPase
MPVKKSYDDYVQQFNAFGYKFTMNDMNDVVCCNDLELNKGIEAEILSKMIDEGFAASRVSNEYIRIAHNNRFHPLKDYFENLQWLGEDIFGKLMSCFEFENEEFGKAAHWRFLHGVVGKVLNQDQNFMLVLDGKQGIGKSYYSSWLCPLDKYFVEGTLNPDSKDTRMRIASNLLWEVGELQYTTRKSDIEALKNIITERRVTVRPPYASNDITKPVSCSFIGTINENGAGFLNDPTGTRRFAVVKIKSIDWQGYTRINKDQLWAQIVATYKAGERGYLTKEESQEQFEINSNYTLISSTHEVLLKFYDIDPDKYPNEWISSADILLELFSMGMTGSQKAAQMEIASIMEQLGVEKSNLNAVTGQGRLTCYRGVKHK